MTTPVLAGTTWKPGDKRDFLGASDMSTILGLNPWVSPYSLWCELVGIIKSEHSDDMLERFQIGHDAEPFLASVFTRRTGLHVVGEQTEVRHPRAPWLQCHTDGFAAEGPGDWTLDSVLGGVEFKTSGDLTPWPQGEIPAYYQAQAQLAMLLTGLDRWWFCVGFSRWKVEVYDLKADRADQALILSAARRFWRHVTSGIPPEVDGSKATTDALARAWTPDPDATVDVDDDLVQALIDAQAEAKHVKALVAELENLVKAALGEATTGLTTAGKVTWKPQTTRRVAGLKEIEQHDPALAVTLANAGLITESTSRVLRITPAKGTS